jgi:hypothetical protein
MVLLWMVAIEFVQDLDHVRIGVGARELVASAIEAQYEFPGHALSFMGSVGTAEAGIAVDAVSTGNSHD